MKPKARKLAKPEPDFDEQDDNLPVRPMTQLEAASFIEGTAAELRIIARNTKLNALAYFLEMARLEASVEIERLAKSIDKNQ